MEILFYQSDTGKKIWFIFIYRKGGQTSQILEVKRVENTFNFIFYPKFVFDIPLYLFNYCNLRLLREAMQLSYYYIFCKITTLNNLIFHELYFI